MAGSARMANASSKAPAAHPIRDAQRRLAPVRRWFFSNAWCDGARVVCDSDRCWSPPWAGSLSSRRTARPRPLHMRRTSEARTSARRLAFMLAGAALASALGVWGFGAARDLDASAPAAAYPTRAQLLDFSYRGRVRASRRGRRAPWRRDGLGAGLKRAVPARRHARASG